jgi:hypothetical protein
MGCIESKIPWHAVYRRLSLKPEGGGPSRKKLEAGSTNMSGYISIKEEFQTRSSARLKRGSLK